MVKRILYLVLFGFVSHKLTFPLSNEFGHKWGILIRHATGAILLIPAREMIRPVIDMEEGCRKRIVVSIMAALPFGIGVFLGHYLDKDSV